MFYDFAITVPPNTPREKPIKQEMKLTKGVIHRIEVQFPIGCAGLVHVRLYHNEAVFLPTNPEGSFASDGYVIPIDEHFELKTEPYTLIARLWNEDDTYEHTITLRIGILPKEVLAPLAPLVAKFRRFFRLIGLE